MNLGILVGIEFESLTTPTEGMCREVGPYSFFVGGRTSSEQAGLQSVSTNCNKEWLPPKKANVDLFCLFRA